MKMTFKSILPGLLLLFCLNLQAQTPKAVSGNPAEEAVWAVVQEAFDAFSAYDAPRFAAVFAEDVDFVSPMGSILHGRKQVEETHAQLFKMWGTPNPTLKREVMNKEIDFLHPDLALVVLQNKVSDTEKGESEQNAFTILAEKEKGKWQIRSVQLTPVKPMPDMGKK